MKCQNKIFQIFTWEILLQVGYGYTRQYCTNTDIYCFNNWLKLGEMIDQMVIINQTAKQYQSATYVFNMY